MNDSSEKFRLQMPILAGLVVSALIVLIFLSIAGGRHGWLSPWFNSATSLILAPLDFSISYNWRRINWWITACVLLIGLLLDGLLIIATYNEGLEYFFRVGAGDYFWLTPWLSWQVALVMALILQGLHFGALRKRRACR